MSGSEEILTGLGQGDPGAIGALLEQHLAPLRAFIRLHAGKEIRAKEEHSDIVQSVCRELLQNAHRFEFRGEAAFRGWLYTAALRKVVQRARYYRRAARDIGREQPPAAATGAPDLLEVYRTVCSPSRAAIAREELARVEAVIDALPEHYREVLLLSRIAGLSQREIGERIGKSEIAVQRILSRALAKLATLLCERD